MTDELKAVRCGCGGEAVAIGDADNNIYFVKCDKCWISTDLFHSEAEAVEVWNKAMGAKDTNVLCKERTAKVKSKNYYGTTTNTVGDFTCIGKCENCDCEVNEHYAYCPYCGARLEWK